VPNFFFPLLDFFPQKIFRLAAQQVADPRADKAVTRVQIDHQDQIGKAFQ
jgi:hypothetical protein